MQIGNRLRVKSSRMAPGQDWHGGQMPRSSPGEGAGGGGWAQLELTDP